jgi:hypothetical protein
MKRFLRWAVENTWGRFWLSAVERSELRRDRKRQARRRKEALRRTLAG